MFLHYYLIILLLSLIFAAEHKEVEIDLITYEVKPYISGIRVVNIENGLIGYSEAGESIIYPDTKIKIVIFGYHLDKIGKVAFTNDNCFNSVINITHSDFLIQTVKRIEFTAFFANSDLPYRICYKERLNNKESSEDEEDMIMLDEMRTWISTESPVRIYYLPLHLQIGIIFVLFCLSALFSGLNLGLMALSPQELMLIQKSGSSTERKYAEIILPVRQSGNYLLCTILIMNVVVNAAISILFEDMTNGIYALIIASFSIVVVGEIIPQSICIKKGLAVGAYTIWLTRAFMILTFPLSYPISKVLDIFLGEDTPVYDKRKLINLMKMSKNTENEDFAEDLKIAVGAMEIYEKNVGDVLTKIEDVFMLPENMILDAVNIAEIIRCGYSRIPVYKEGMGNKITSLLMVKDLALIDPHDNFTVRMVCNFHCHPLRVVNKLMSLRLMLEEFKEGNYHLAVVESVHSIYDPITGTCMKELLGIVTLEDIVEEILQAEIVDESDAIIDNVHRSRRIYSKEPNITKILVGEVFNKDLSLPMEKMIICWAKQFHAIFSEEYIDQRALASLIKRNVKQVNLIHLPRFRGNPFTKKDSVYIYKENVPSDRFILILEGRVTIKYGQMEFEAGPWHSFGCEILDQLDEYISGDIDDSAFIADSKMSLLGSIQFSPDFSAQVNEFCRFVQFTSGCYLNAFKVTKIVRSAREMQAHGSNRSLMKSGQRSVARQLSEISGKNIGSKYSFDSFINRSIISNGKRRSNSDTVDRRPAPQPI